VSNGSTRSPNSPSKPSSARAKVFLRLPAGSTTFISRLLLENKHYFDEYGPHSNAAVSNPASSAFAIWVARRLDTILPNNRKILEALEVNDNLIPSELAGDGFAFKDHAKGYEMNQYGRLETYRLFPQSFAVSAAKWADND
jgi:hypothetical protein